MHKHGATKKGVASIRRAVFELSVPHYRNKLTGGALLSFTATLIEACRALNLEVVVRFSLWSAKAAPRHPNENEIIFCYHSFGRLSPRVIHFKEGYLSGYYYLDVGGFSGWSTAAFDDSLLRLNGTESAASEYCQALKKEFLSGSLSKYPQNQNESHTIFDGNGRQIIFVPLQTQDDIVGVLWDISPDDLFEWIQSSSDEGSQLFIIKRHPLCRDLKISKNLQKLANKSNVIIYTGSTLSAIEACDVTLCWNSGVGFEALVLGKPLITMARSDYKVAACYCATIDEVDLALRERRYIKYSGSINSFVFNFMKNYQFKEKDRSEIIYKIESLLADPKIESTVDRSVDKVWHAQMEELRRGLITGERQFAGLIPTELLVKILIWRIKRWVRLLFSPRV